MMGKWIVFIAVCSRNFFLTGSVKANSVILDELVAKLHTNNTLVAWAFSLQNGLSYLLSPAVGLLLQSVSCRKLGIFGGVTVGLAYIYCGLAVDSVGKLFVAYAASGVGHSCLGITSLLVLKEHFKEKYPKMFATSAMFHFLGVAFLPPLIQFFKDRYGLNASLVLFGALLWNLATAGVSFRIPKDRLKKTKSLGNITGGEEEDGCIKGDSWTEQQQHKMNRCTPKSCIKYFSLILIHKTFAVLVIIDFLMLNVFLSWAIFLVSLGKAAGLTAAQAVFLSSAGGIGGIAGKMTSAMLFHMNCFNAFTGAVIPIAINCFCFLGCALFTDFYSLIAMATLTGFCLAMFVACAAGLIPSLVCEYHFSRALAINFFVDGFAVQFGGFFSGLLLDCLGSTRYVYGFNAFICSVALILAMIWACRNENVVECQPEEE